MSTAVLTMVYDDDFFLKRWVDYYGQFVSRRNLVVLTHGRQDSVWDIAAGASIVELERNPDNKNLDAHRWATLGHFARGLLLQYTHVICVDVDEFLVSDPATGKSIVDVVSTISKNKVLHPNSVEIVHRTDLEQEFDFSRPVLVQRSYFRTNKWYSKPCMITDKSIMWKMDGHCTLREVDFHPDTYLFHLKWFDQNFLMQRSKVRHDMMRNSDGEVFMAAGGGWALPMDGWSEMFSKTQQMTISGLECDFAAYRSEILGSAIKHPTFDYYIYPRNTSKVLYKVPDRFLGLF